MPTFTFDDLLLWSEPPSESEAHHQLTNSEQVRRNPQPSGNNIARKVQVVAARAWAYATRFGRIPLRCRPQRYKCPHCKWDFARRKKRCCPGCGTLLLIVSDMLSDAELTELRSFLDVGPSEGKVGLRPGLG
jgi:hypothetical protein